MELKTQPDTPKSVRNAALKSLLIADKTFRQEQVVCTFTVDKQLIMLQQENGQGPRLFQLQRMPYEDSVMAGSHIIG